MAAGPALTGPAHLDPFRLEYIGYYSPVITRDLSEFSYELGRAVLSRAVGGMLSSRAVIHHASREVAPDPEVIDPLHREDRPNALPAVRLSYPARSARESRPPEYFVLDLATLGQASFRSRQSVTRHVVEGMLAVLQHSPTRDLRPGPYNIIRGGYKLRSDMELVADATPRGTGRRFPHNAAEFLDLVHLLTAPILTASTGGRFLPGVRLQRIDYPLKAGFYLHAGDIIDRL